MPVVVSLSVCFERKPLGPSKRLHLVRFTRPSLGVQTPARGCELFFVPGVVCRSFFSRGGGRVLRPCGVGWNLRVSGAINGRPGRLPAFCAAAPQHPSTSVLSALPRDLLRGAPWGEVQRDRPRGSCVIFCAGAYGSRASRLQRRGSTCWLRVGASLQHTPAAAFLRAAVLPETSSAPPVCTQSDRSKSLPALASL